MPAKGNQGSTGGVAIPATCYPPSRHRRLIKALGRKRVRGLAFPRKRRAADQPLPGGYPRCVTAFCLARAAASTIPYPLDTETEPNRTRESRIWLASVGESGSAACATQQARHSTGQSHAPHLRGSRTRPATAFRPARCCGSGPDCRGLADRWGPLRGLRPAARRAWLGAARRPGE